MPDKDWTPGPYLEPFLGVDGGGNLYATAPSSKTVLKFDKDGKMVGEKGKEGTYTLLLPTGIWVTKDATVYVADTNGNSVVNLGKIP